MLVTKLNLDIKMKLNLNKNRYAIGCILVALYSITIVSVNSQLDFGRNPLAGLKELLEKAKAKTPSKGPGGPIGGQQLGEGGNLGQGHHGHGHVQIVPQSKFIVYFKNSY